MTNNISKEEIGILVRKHPYDPSWETNKDGSKNEAVISARLEYLLSLGSEIKIIDPPVDNNKTLRDEIAIASLTGLIMAGFDVRVIPVNAYKLADLMIEKMQKDK